MTFFPAPLRVSDIEQVLRVQALAYGPGYIESTESFRAKIEASNCCFGIFDSGHLLAYAVAFPWRHGQTVPLDSSTPLSVSAPDSLYIHDVAVDPAFGGKGFAQNLVNLVVNQAHGLGVEWIDLVAVQTAKSYWSQLGFEVESAAEGGYGGEAVKMSIKLIRGERNITARPARKDDLDQIFQLVTGHEAFGVNEEIKFYEPSELLSFIEDPAWAIGVVAGNRGQILGFSSLHRLSWHWSMLDNFFVDPSSRESGFGRALIDWTMASARLWRSRYITALVDPGDERTKAFFTKSGWEFHKNYTWMDYSPSW